jgi:integrase
MARKSTRRTRQHRPWNKGKSVGQKRPFTPEQVQLIKRTLDADGNLRDLALFSTAIDTMLRSIDLLCLTVEDVTDDVGHVVDEITIRQQKNSEANVVGISDYTRKVLGRWIIANKKLPEDHLFTRLKGDKRKPLTRDHYRELVKRWARIARVDPRAFSTHSLRRTKAAYIYEQTRNIEVIRELLGQKSVSATSAYLNVGKKKALAIARKFDI